MVLAPGVTPGGFVPAPLAYAGWHSDQIHVFDTCCKTWLLIILAKFLAASPKTQVLPELANVLTEFFSWIEDGPDSSQMKV